MYICAIFSQNSLGMIAAHVITAVDVQMDYIIILAHVTQVIGEKTANMVSTLTPCSVRLTTRLFYYTFEKRYHVFDLVTPFVCHSVCVSVSASVSAMTIVTRWLDLATRY